MMRTRIMTLGAAMLAMMVAVAAGSSAAAAEVKTLGRLEIPAGAAVMAICTDSTVQNVLSGDLNAHKRAGPPILVTVTVTTRVLSEGVSLQDVSPGDPSVAGMLRDLGAQVPAIGNGGASVPDPYAVEARRQNLTPEDLNTQSFRSYQAMRQSMSAGPETYDNLPARKIYDTAIIARATVSGSQSELKVVAVVHPGDDVHKAKELVGEEIANSILH
ncbi:MAG TPA: hypothetical protein VNF29_08685 [Candidatus Binataceae bacterium]|nr:hypothetical protein [Candidatus Binataceae bacterium]